MHYDFDYLDEDMLANAEMEGNTIRIRDEAYELLILPPMAHLKLSTLERLEKFVSQGGRVLGMIFLPDKAFVDTDKVTGLVDVSDRVRSLFGIDPVETQQSFQKQTGLDLLQRQLSGGGRTAFLRSYALARQLPMRIQQQIGMHGSNGESLLRDRIGSAKPPAVISSLLNRVSGRISQTKSTQSGRPLPIRFNRPFPS